MNPEMLNDPQKFLWPFIQAREVQKQLEEKLLEVEDNFAIQQAMLGWLMDNPWLFFLFLNREAQRIEGDALRETKLEVLKLKEDLKKCQDAAADSIPDTKAALQNMYDLLIKLCRILFALNDKQPSQVDKVEKFKKVLTHLNGQLLPADTHKYMTLLDPQTVQPTIFSFSPTDLDEMKQLFQLDVNVESSDLEKIVGIGRKIMSLLYKHEIRTFLQLAQMKVEDLTKILVDNKLSKSNLSPENWIVQAQLLADNKENEWEEWTKNNKKG